MDAQKHCTLGKFISSHTPCLAWCGGHLTQEEGREVDSAGTDLEIRRGREQEEEEWEGGVREGGRVW